MLEIFCTAQAVSKKTQPNSDGPHQPVIIALKWEPGSDMKTKDSDSFGEAPSRAGSKVRNDVTFTHHIQSPQLGWQGMVIYY